MVARIATVACLIALFISFSNASWGQAGEACGRADDHLFYCTFDEGARKVTLCHYNGDITYEFGPLNGPPELSMTHSVQDIEYTPFAWASRTIFESIKLFNGDTRYEVFSSTERGPYDGRTDGGIVVTLPNDLPVTLTCDARSVWPTDPIEGIGQIGAFIHGHSLDVLSHCLRNLPDHSEPSQCLGSYRDIQIANGSCDVSGNETQCWQTENDQWGALVEIVYRQTLEALENNANTQLASDLEMAQAIWSQTRDLDCRIKGVLLFSPDGGAALCRAEYAAERMTFLNAVIRFSEFDG